MDRKENFDGYVFLFSRVKKWNEPQKKKNRVDYFLSRGGNTFLVFPNGRKYICILKILSL
jgi:hypothetical protein